MAASNEELAVQIAEVSPLSYEKALKALNAGGHVRESALSILESQKVYTRDLERISRARKRLRALA